MHGSVHVGYGGSKKISAEWNVKADAKACQRAFTAPWEMTITPLDTCGLVKLDGDRYAKVRDAKDPIAAAIIANYRIWAKTRSKTPDAAEKFSSPLYDTVAVYLAIRHDLCEMERVNLIVTDDGFTKIDPAGKSVNAAVAWKNLDAYRDFLVERLTK
jgi:inosine-uridine nucleoside N-ribohydrolase